MDLHNVTSIRDYLYLQWQTLSPKGGVVKAIEVWSAVLEILAKFS